MAHLGQKATDGRLSFIKYVTENKRYAEIDYEIEKGQSGQLFKKVGKNLIAENNIFKSGTKLKIIDSKLYEIGGAKFAKVKINTYSGFFPISKIRKPTGGNGTQYEDEVVDGINSFIKKAGGKIDIKLKGDSVVYKKIAYAIKVDKQIKQKANVKGDPKADIILCSDKKNPLAKGSIFISHKKEGGPEAFQQYGGLSEQAGEDINKNKIVQKFLKSVAESIGKGDKLPNPIMMTFDDKTLANMSIYGPDYGKQFSIQHTQIIGQGKPVFKHIKDDLYELSFTSHMSLSGDLSHFTGGYLPVLGATFRAGRGFDYQGKRYNGARVAIYPYKLMATRSQLLILKG
ncbi:hypothetical protein UFOVP410_97 [uncultured Caudovirales phage]|uniref:Uncharacterized protein n=1 Tax=uncultured Caudovirales phage TaxID=2100421 RepID=A0A6J5M3S7_9CAUD|nr:hypothetical protein UFOVP410_97 [uncultured Caudovirales phage]